MDDKYPLQKSLIMKPSRKLTREQVSLENSQPDAPRLPRRLGADHGESASRPRKRHNNFKQSVDIREDRGIRQYKMKPKRKG